MDGAPNGLDRNFVPVLMRARVKSRVRAAVQIAAGATGLALQFFQADSRRVTPPEALARHADASGNSTTPSALNLGIYLGR
jgi:hypothetical protein